MSKNRPAPYIPKPPTTPQQGTASTLQFSMVRSALPPAAELERIERLHPGATEIYLKQWQAQTAHRMSMEDHVIKNQEKRASRGQIFAFILGLTALIGGFALIAAGKNAEGISSLVGAAGMLVTAFFAGTIRGYFERKAKITALNELQNRR